MAVTVLALSACGGSVESSSDISASTASTAAGTSTTVATPSTTTSAVTTTAPADNGTWSKVCTDGNVFVDVAVFDGGFAVSGRGGVWLSATGVDWEKAPGVNENIWVLTAGASGLMGFGRAEDEVASTVSTDGVGWTDWTSLAMDAGPEFAFFNDVLATESGYVAVGQTDGARAGMWSSLDGRTWTLDWQHPDSNSAAMGVSRFGTGFVTVGEGEQELKVPWAPPVAEDPGAALDAIAVKTAAIWVSDDGLTWHWVSKDSDLFAPTGTATPDVVVNTDAGHVAAGDAGIVVVGSYVHGSFTDPPQPERSVAMWHSPDGRQWAAVDQPEAFDGGTVWALIATHEGFMAGGQSNGAAALWTSQDGLTWTRLDLDPDVFGSSSRIHGLLAQDRIVVAVGEDDGTGAIWIRQRN